MGFAERELHPERSPRDLYGSEIRRHRELAGKMTLTRLAEILNFSKAHLSRIECAESPPPPGLSEKLDVAFGTDGLFVRLYPHAKVYQLPDRYRRYMQLASEAVVFEAYTNTIHGLLQTPAIAWELLRAGDPFAPDREIDNKVKARLERQQRLHGPMPPRYWFVMDESVLRRSAKGRTEMRSQLELLADVAKMRHVTFQIMPFSAGFHSELGGSLTILTLPSGNVVGYEEGSRTGTLIEERDEAATRRAYYDLLRAQALSPRESLELTESQLQQW
ncbi:transcriptional regulator [Streptomyces tateyamensis]|uniref:Transcriptional regulator n=1 Tax=Streptomyces tateyamensis TaxID=565073 RepID=A0A2V4NWP0_9ACTN|nr:helix-turn-helix transcriptional regulator [Streptomyces tateyamensis]PYC88477.1 transcriptional regulator [Streptomyces tateyamensis]